MTKPSAAFHTFGIPKERWKAAVLEARKILRERAKAQRTIGYAELTRMLQTVQFEARDVRLYTLLEEISRAEDAKGRGLLSAIVVHKDGDHQPGEGFFTMAAALGRDVKDHTDCWIGEIRQVYRAWKKRAL